jgi:hypothetical protein
LLSPDADFHEAPVVSLADLCARFPDFENVQAPRTNAIEFAVPWDPPPKVVLLAPWFTSNAAVVLPEFTLNDLERLAPEAVAAPVETLRALANLAIRSDLVLPSLSYGAIALLGIGRDLVREDDHDLIWRAFRIPLYSQFRGFRGELLAADCELHEGLHILTESAVFEESDQGLLVTSFGNLRHPVLRLASGLSARIVACRCPCGLKSPRLVALAVHRTTPKRIAAAS